MGYAEFNALSEDIRSAVMSKVTKEMPSEDGYVNLSVASDEFSCMTADGKQSFSCSVSDIKPKPAKKRPAKKRAAKKAPKK